MNMTELLQADSHIYGRSRKIRYNYVQLPDNEDTKFVKRILGLPGEIINVVDGKVYITDSDSKKICRRRQLC